MTQTTGTQQAAQAAFDAYVYGMALDGTEVTLIGRGEDRSAYLIGGTVYKVGYRDSANVADHANLTAARAAGHAWAPRSELYYAVDEFGRNVPVMAMPYIEDDGSEMAPETEAAFRATAGAQVDRIGGNYVVVNGQPVVLDGCTLS